jgi:hypothetical protein
MKRENGRVVLEFPDDYRGFTFRGVRFARTTQLHETGQYTVTVLRSSRTYTVHGASSKRYPWRAVADTAIANPSRPDEPFADAGHYANLIDAAENLAFVDETIFGRGRPFVPPPQPQPAGTAGEAV